MINLLFLLGDVLKKGFIGIILTLDTLIYGLISSAFKVFMAIASARLLSSDAYYAIANKIYLIIGVIMLFVLSYAMLKAIVNPDEGKKSFGPGLIKRIVIAVVGLAIAPALFNLMYQVQGLVLEHNVLGKIFFRSDNTQKTDASSVTIGDQTIAVDSVNPDDYINVVGGSVTATTIWQAFFYPAPDSGKTADEIIGKLSDYYLTNAGMYGVACAVSGYVAYAGYAAGGWGYLVGLLGTAVGLWTCSEAVGNVVDAIGASGEEISLAEAYALTAKGESFGMYTIFINSYYEDGDIAYLYGVSTIAGAFTLYAFVTFSIDMGVRAGKLAYYQIIAPVPLIMQVLPKNESTFKNYTKGVIDTFLEVFIRIAVVYIVVYIICHLQDLFSSVDSLWGNQDLSSPEVMLAMAFLIIGLIIFCKDAPKFLSKTLGVEGGNLDLGIRNKLAKGGAFTAASAIGGGVTAGVNNLTNKWKNADNWKNKHGHVTLGSITKNLIGGVGSAAAGTVSGGVRGGVAGKKAGTFRDVKSAAAQGAQGAIRARDNRQQYWDAYGENGLGGVIEHRIEDKITGVLRWAGIDSAAGLDAQLATLNEIEKKADALKAAAKNQIEGDVNKNKRNVTYGVTTRFDSLVTDSATHTTGLAAYDAKNGTRFSALTGADAIAHVDDGFNTSVLKDIKDKMMVAQTNGDYAGINYAAWQDLYNFYLKNFGDEVQNRALLSDAHYSAIGSGDQAALAGVRNAALEFRTALGDNLGASVIADANNVIDPRAQAITASTLQGQDLIVNQDSAGRKSAISELGDRIKITRAEVTRKRQEIRKKEETASGGGGKK